jgi:probable rRNA maturation factor
MIRPRGRRAHGAPLVVDIMVESVLWKDQRGVRPLLRRAVAEAAAMLSTSGAELAIVLTDDSAIRGLNRNWRGKDEPTNVLAFPAKQPPVSGGARRRVAPRFLGDIVIACETLKREAAAQHMPFRQHLAHLAVHGFLHLCGHDHATAKEAAVMERLEIAILARLGFPDPYVAHGRNG